MLPLGSYFYLNLASALFIFAAALVPIFLSVRLKGPVRQLTAIFSLFIVIHGFYHIAVLLGYEFIGAGIFDPLSVAILTSFGLFYFTLLRRYNRSKTAI